MRFLLLLVTMILVGQVQGNLGTVHAAEMSANINLASPPAAIDGVTLTADRKYLLGAQTDKTENGIHYFDGATLSRPNDDSLRSGCSTLLLGSEVFVSEGNSSAGRFMTLSASDSEGVDGYENHVLTIDTHEQTFVTRLAVESGEKPTVILTDTKSHNNDGGTFTGGSRQTRDINTVNDGGGFVTLDTNNSRFTLASGVWRVEWSAPAFAVGRHWTFLRNHTQSSDASSGTAEFCSSSSGTMTKSIGAARLVSNGTDELTIQHQCQSTKTVNGLGVATNVSGNDSIYLLVKCQKLD